MARASHPFDQDNERAGVLLFTRDALKMPPLPQRRLADMRSHLKRFEVRLLHDFL